MALAEARAAWQRIANRCLVQEDAKRAPILACSSSATHSIKQADRNLNSAIGCKDIPSSLALPFNPLYSNLSPYPNRWLHLQTNYGTQKGIMDELEFDSLEGNMETIEMHDQSLKVLSMNEKDSNLIDQTTSDKSYCNSQCRSMEFSSWVCEEDVEVSKSGNEIYFVSESSWLGAERNIPWWKTADKDELALLVAQKSVDHIENCDLPMPQNNTHVNKDGIPGSLLSSRNLHASGGSLTVGSACQKLCMSAEGQVACTTDEPLRDIRSQTKAQLMEALRHSQTRAREAEKAAKHACAEREHVIKLVFGQASRLFAYKQWLRILQLENMHLRFINNTSWSVSLAFPIMLPQRRKKIQHSWHNRKRPKSSCLRCRVGKYATVLALGLGLAGAGFLMGWMLQSW